LAVFCDEVAVFVKEVVRVQKLSPAGAHLSQLLAKPPVPGPVPLRAASAYAVPRTLARTGVFTLTSAARRRALRLRECPHRIDLSSTDV
jgi:hypothetical protein